MSRECNFFDTSALFKRYISEAGTDKIDMIFEKTGLFIISSLTVIELISNLRRLVDVDKVIDDDLFNVIKSEFFNDIADGTIKVEPISSLNIITSVELLNKTYISPIDSLQLATVINLKENYNNIFFICSDKKLCSIAEKEGIAVLRID